MSDVYAREFQLEIRMRRDDRKPETVKEIADAGRKANAFISSIAHLLTLLSGEEIAEQNSTNLQVTFGQIGELIVNLTSESYTAIDEMHDRIEQLIQENNSSESESVN